MSKLAHSNQETMDEIERRGRQDFNGEFLPDAPPITKTQRLVDYFAEIQSCLESVHGALRHRQQPQDYHFHAALKACRDGSALACSSEPISAGRGEWTGRCSQCAACFQTRAELEEHEREHSSDRNAALREAIAIAKDIIMFDGAPDVKLGIEIAQKFIISGLERSLKSPPTVG